VQFFRRKRSLKDRAIRRGRALRKAAPQLDIPWARSWLAGAIRENFLRFVLRPTMNLYTRRRSTGSDRLSRIKGPVILVANHASHIDTPVILAALPRRFRKRTAVAAAADYFYRNRMVAALVSLIFNTVPLDRDGGGLGKQATEHLDKLLDQGWNLLLYPEGTRTRSGGPGRVRRGAAVLAAAHNLSIVPIRVTGTREAMPPGRLWPKRLHGKVLSRRHRIEVSFGEPIRPTGDATALIERVQRFFDSGNGDGGPSASPYRRRRLVGTPE
jgi:1-acyl-sn-glycerol-3-phosphate acyltransferase